MSHAIPTEAKLGSPKTSYIAGLVSPAGDRAQRSQPKSSDDRFELFWSYHFATEGFGSTLKVRIKPSTYVEMKSRQNSTKFKSTLWSKFWSSMGMLFLTMGLITGSTTIYFYATSVVTDVTVANVMRSQKSPTKTSYAYVFEAEGPDGDILSHQAKMRTGRKLHTRGQVVAGRVSKSSDRVLSDEILTSFKWHATVTLLFGFYAGRRVIFGPFTYWFGRFIGLVSSLFTKPRKTF